MTVNQTDGEWWLHDDWVETVGSAISSSASNHNLRLTPSQFHHSTINQQWSCSYCLTWPRPAVYRLGWYSENIIQPRIKGRTESSGGMDDSNVINCSRCRSDSSRHRRWYGLFIWNVETKVIIMPSIQWMRSYIVQFQPKVREFITTKNLRGAWFRYLITKNISRKNNFTI